MLLPVGPKEQLHRNHSGQVEAGQMGSLAKDLTASRKKLIDQGIMSLIASLIADLKVTSPTLSEVKMY